MGTENLSTALRVLIVGGTLIGLACIATFGLLQPEATTSRKAVSNPRAEAQNSVSVFPYGQPSRLADAPSEHSVSMARFPVPELPSIRATSAGIQRTGNGDRLRQSAASDNDGVPDRVESDRLQTGTMADRSLRETEERLAQIERQMRSVLHRFDQSDSAPGTVAAGHPARFPQSATDPGSTTARLSHPKPDEASEAAVADTPSAQPAPETNSGTAASSQKAAVTVVSEQPLRVNVRSRSTTIADLLTEFAAVTGSDLVISTLGQYPVRAVSLSHISPESLFALLSENQMFEILYESHQGEASRIKLVPHRRITRRNIPGPAPSENGTGHPDIHDRTTAGVRNLSQPTVQSGNVDHPADHRTTKPAAGPSGPVRLQTRNTRILVRHPDSQQIAEISEPVTPETETTDRGQRTGSQSSRPQRHLVSNSPASANPASGPDRQSASDSGPAPIPFPSTAAESNPGSNTQNQKHFDIRATVVHLVTTSTLDSRPEGITPIHLPDASSPGHKSAAQHAVNQAVQLGRVTPVSDAAVTIAAGQSANLKIGSLCLHCNAERGLSAGDTMRLTVDNTAPGHPRVTVQGFAPQSSEPLPKLGPLTTTLSGTRSFLITESGTSGSVTVHENRTGLARLPIISHMLGRSRPRQVRQIAQRLIIVTLLPTGPGPVAATGTAAGQTRLAAAGLIPGSGQPSPDLLPQSATRSAQPAPAGHRTPFVMPQFPPPAPAPLSSSPVATPDSSSQSPPLTRNPPGEPTPAPPVEMIKTTSSTGDTSLPVTSTPGRSVDRAVSSPAFAVGETRLTAVFTSRPLRSPDQSGTDSGRRASAASSLPKIDSLAKSRHRQPPELVIIESLPETIPLSIDDERAELPIPDDV